MAKRVLQEKAQEIKEEEKIEVIEELAKEDLKEINKEEKKNIKEARVPGIVPGEWVPKTKLGKEVLDGKVNDINKLFQEGIKISESEIADVLLPNLNNEIILVGGSAGKGGGIRRTPFKRTTRMHKSGRRFKISVMVAAGNSNGYLGLGYTTGPPGKHKDVIEKSLRKAKLNIIPIKRGCGSWECNCGGSHSIPFTVVGKSGSVKVKLMPAPKGIGLAVSDEMKKIMRLSGIKDIWCKSYGSTKTRVNFARAVFNALKKLNTYKTQKGFEEISGSMIGRCD